MSGATGMRITSIHNQSTGSRDLNDEYVILQNYGPKSFDIAGFKITDQTATQQHVHIYTLPELVAADGARDSTWRFDPGEVIYIRTGSGRDKFFPATQTAKAQYHLYMGRKAFVWNNAGDRVYLRHPNGEFATQPFPVPHK